MAHNMLILMQNTNKDPLVYTVETDVYNVWNTSVQWLIWGIFE